MECQSPLSEQSICWPSLSRDGQSSKGEAQIRWPQSRWTGLGVRAQALELQNEGPVFTFQPYSEPSPPGRGPRISSWSKSTPQLVDNRQREPTGPLQKLCVSHPTL